MNMFKKTGGFTLVELIVVIAILAILAGVAIPAYSGYITKAQEAGDLTNLNAVQTAVNAKYAVSEYLPTQIEVTEGAAGTASVVATVDGTDEDVTSDADFLAFYGADSFSIDLKSGSSATWQRDTSKWTIAE